MILIIKKFVLRVDVDEIVRYSWLRFGFVVGWMLPNSCCLWSWAFSARVFSVVRLVDRLVVPLLGRVGSSPRLGMAHCLVRLD